jgi:hypothetical protein
MYAKTLLEKDHLKHGAFSGISNLAILVMGERSPLLNFSITFCKLAETFSDNCIYCSSCRQEILETGADSTNSLFKLS